MITIISQVVSRVVSAITHILITTDSTQYTIDTTTLYTIDNNNTTT